MCWLFKNKKQDLLSHGEVLLFPTRLWWLNNDCSSLMIKFNYFLTNKRVQSQYLLGWNKCSIQSESRKVWNSFALSVSYLLDGAVVGIETISRITKLFTNYLFPTLLPSSGMPCHKQSWRKLPWQHSADVWQCTCSAKNFAPCVFFLIMTFSVLPYGHFSTLNIQVNGIMRYKSGHHHHHHHHHHQHAFLYVIEHTMTA